MYLDGSLCNDALWRVLAITPPPSADFFRHRYNQVTLTQAGRTPYVHIDTEATEDGSTVYSGRTHLEMLKGCLFGGIVLTCYCEMYLIHSDVTLVFCFCSHKQVVPLLES